MCVCVEMKFGFHMNLTILWPSSQEVKLFLILHMHSLPLLISLTGARLPEEGLAIEVLIILHILPI